MSARKTTVAKSFWLWLFAFVILLGIGFRCVGLGDRVYWVDEVATSIRVAGHTRSEIIAQLTDAPPKSPAELQQFLQLNPATPWRETLAALAHSPEHSPLYFLLARLWAQIWGSSVVAMRSLPVLLSLVAIALMGGLAYWLLGDSQRTGRLAAGMAMALFASSPYFVAYAQEARPYSLWSVTLLLSGLLLLKAIQSPGLLRWLGYGLSVAAGFYTSLLTVIVVAGQGVFVVIGSDRKCIRGFGLAMLVAGASFLPWMLVIVQHWGLLEDNTEWMREPMGLLSFIAIWLYSLVIVFFDAPVVLLSPMLTAMKFVTALLVLTIMGIGVHWLSRRTTSTVRGLVLAFMLPIPVVLILLDLLQQGQASATPRYLFPLQLGMILAIAGWLLTDWDDQTPGIVKNTRCHNTGCLFRKGVLAFLLTVSILSCISNLGRIPDYQKSRSRHNERIAEMINKSPLELLLVESNQAIDILSLSRHLDESIKIQVFGTMPVSSNSCDAFLFNPSESLQKQLQQSDHLTAQEIFRPPLLTPTDVHLSLWRVSLVNNSCPAAPAIE